MGFPDGSVSKEFSCNAGASGSIPGSRRSLEEGMTTPSSILAWRIPWTEDPGRLQSMEQQRVRAQLMRLSTQTQNHHKYASFPSVCSVPEVTGAMSLQQQCHPQTSSVVNKAFSRSLSHLWLKTTLWNKQSKLTTPSIQMRNWGSERLFV